MISRMTSIRLALAVTTGFLAMFVNIAQAATVTVNIVGFSFSPSAATINVGDTVVWSGLANYGLPLPQNGATFSGGSAGILIGNNVGYSLDTTQAGLYSPYDAKIIGDYTGLTPP